MRPHGTKDRQELVPSQVSVPDGTNHVPKLPFVPAFVAGNSRRRPEGASIQSTSQLAAGLGKMVNYSAGKWSILGGNNGPC